MRSDLLPPFPQTQALNSKTFRPPPLDGSLTLPEIFDWHLSKNPHHPLFGYTDDDGRNTTIYWQEGVRAVHQAARIIRERLGCDPESAPDTSRGTPVVAIIAAADTITYYTVITGVMRAGYTCFPISPRNSPAAIAHLLAKTSAAHVLVGGEHALRALVDASLAMLGAQQAALSAPRVSAIPEFADLYLAAHHEAPRATPAFKRPGLVDVAMIIHSSGSTAFPKPILWTYRALAELTIIPWFGERDITGQRWGCHSIPMYHGMGIMQMLWSASCGIILTTFEPRSPAIPPNADSVIKHAMSSQSDLIYCVPSFIEAWSRDSEHVSSLASISGIAFGGGPLNKEVGDTLTSKGVTIFSLYGLTEGGCVSNILLRDIGRDWEYFKITPQMKPAFIPDGSGASELILIATAQHNPVVLNTTYDGTPAYATNDLLLPHPSRPGLWKIFGRADDQIIHSTGEKTNPGPLENILNQDPRVLSSILFGRGRFQVGALVDLQPAYKFDPADVQRLAEFRNEIWPTVERMNAYAPQHSRLFKEMILVATPSKPFAYTAKNTVRRQVVVTDYTAEIEALFAAVDETAQADISPPLAWDAATTREFVRTVVGRVLKKQVADDDDIFQNGCDSLQATWIRNTLLRAVREGARVETRSVSSNFVYQHSSVASLAEFISSVVQDAHVLKSSSAKIEDMHNMVAKYTANFGKHDPSVDAPTGKVALLTGSTGGLGSNILTLLAKSSAFTRIYAFNRKASDGTPLQKRQAAALEERGLNAAILGSEKVVLIEGDLSEADLGISADLLQELRSSVTHIIHNAWRVDFNLALTSFEPNVRGLRHLIDLALSSPFPSPPRLLFTSSIGVFQHIVANSEGPMKEAPIEAAVAVSTGYTESKWVSEKILEIAASETPLHPVTIRVGQLSGGENGAWNTAEWLPSIVLSGVYLKCLPAYEGDVSWIPLQVAASAIIDFCDTSFAIVHLVHPRPVPWSVIFSALSSALGVPLVPYAEWFAQLEKSTETTPLSEVESMRRNPALRIIDFFRAVSAAADAERPDMEAMGLPKLSTAKALKASSTLADDALPRLGADDALRWLGYWRSIGYIPT